MKKNNTKSKKYEITENKNTAHNSQFIRRNMEIGMTNGQQKWDYYILSKQFKTTRQSFQDKIY